MADIRRPAIMLILATLAALALLLPWLHPATYTSEAFAHTSAAFKMLYAIAALLGLLLPRILARIILHEFDNRLEYWVQRVYHALCIQRLEVLSAAQIRYLLRTFSRGAHIALVWALWGLLAARMLTLFPAAQPLAHDLRTMVLNPLRALGAATLDYLPNAIEIVVILVVTRYLLKLIHVLFHAIEAGIIVLPDFYPEWAEPTYKIIRMFVFVFIPFLVLPLLPGANSRFFNEISFFIGLLVSLGSTSAIKNMTAGIVLTYTRSFQIGDRVCIGDVTGDVQEKSLFVTRINTVKNEQVALPNGSVLESNIINYSTLAADDGLVLHTSITIGYDVDWRQVQDLLIRAATQTPGILPAPRPFVLQTSLDDYYVAYEINAYTDQPQRMAAILSALRSHILDSFHGAGVEIMSPSYSALRNGSDIAIPTQGTPHQLAMPQQAVALTLGYAALPQEK